MKKNIIYLLSNLGKTTSDVNVVVARFMLMTKTSRLKLKLQLFQFGDVNATMDVIGKKCRKNAAQTGTRFWFHWSQQNEEGGRK